VVVDATCVLVREFRAKVSIGEYNYSSIWVCKHWQCLVRILVKTVSHSNSQMAHISERDCD